MEKNQKSMTYQGTHRYKEKIFMKAKAWKGATYGLRVGRANAEEFFSRDWECVELEMDGQVHAFTLSDTFWTTCPELRGTAIEHWLQRHGLAPWPHRKPPSLEVVPLGGNRFRLSQPSQSV